MSSRTDNAVRLGDDLTEATFATMTTGEGGGGGGDDRGGSSGEENDATGILRESRYSRPSQPANAEPDVPIDVGESVSNTHILRAIADMMDVTRRDNERLLQVVQQEQTKRTALEGRLHSQLLLQSESMVS